MLHERTTQVDQCCIILLEARAREFTEVASIVHSESEATQVRKNPGWRS